MFDMAKELARQLFRKPATNAFPTKHAPGNVTKLLERVKKGEAKINPPIETPPGFRGRLSYDREKCIMCKQCIRVCPAGALEVDEKNNRIKHFVSRCVFCGQCVDICPTKALSQTSEFLLSSYDKKMGFAEPEKKQEEKSNSSKEGKK